MKKWIAWFRRLMPESEVKRWLRQREERREKQLYCFHVVWEALQTAGFRPMLSGGNVTVFLPQKGKLSIPVFST